MLDRMCQTARSKVDRHGISKEAEAQLKAIENLFDTLDAADTPWPRVARRETKFSKQSAIPQERLSVTQSSQYRIPSSTAANFGHVVLQDEVDFATGGTRLVLSLLVLVLLLTPASAEDLSGRVMNGTTGKPLAFIEVADLIPSGDGMNGATQVQTDKTGHFRFWSVDPAQTHVLRIIYQGVTYHKMAAPAEKSLLIEVYDAAQKLNDVFAIMDVQRFEATNDALTVRQLITVRNESKPPRTLVNDRTFEIQLPSEAHVKSGLVQIGNAQPLKEKPAEHEQKGKYSFRSPIRPGDTRFAVVYQLPYNREAVIEPKVRDARERFVIMLPKTMTFEAKVPGLFRPLEDVSPDNVQETSAQLRLGETPTFRISGIGTLEEFRNRPPKDEDGEAAQKSLPGGGLGTPIGAPPPLQQYRWQILAGFSLMLMIGAIYVMRKNPLPCPREFQAINRQAASRAQGSRSSVRLKGLYKRQVRA